MAKWLQFRLRTVLIAVAVVAVILKLLEPYYSQHRLAALVVEMGGQCLTEPVLPEWVPGSRYVIRVHEIGFWKPLTDAQFARLVEARGVEQIRRIGFYQSSFSHSNVAKLERFSSCEFLQFFEVDVTDEDMVHFEQMPALKMLVLHQTKTSHPPGRQLINSKAHRHSLKIVAS